MADVCEAGNSIAGFILDEAMLGRATTYMVYRNWNWENNQWIKLWTSRGNCGQVSRESLQIVEGTP